MPTSRPLTLVGRRPGAAAGDATSRASARFRVSKRVRSPAFGSFFLRREQTHYALAHDELVDFLLGIGDRGGRFEALAFG
jgi:hypothetical protein